MPFLSLGEELAKLDEPFHLGKAASEVSLKRAFVSNVAVGREFRETMLPGPALSGLHERSSDAAPPRTWFDVPAFYVGNRSGIAPIGERANRELEKSQGTVFSSARKTAAIVGTLRPFRNASASLTSSAFSASGQSHPRRAAHAAPSPF